MCRRVIILMILSSFFSLLFAQQDALYTHYMYNTLIVNPAYAGSRDVCTITALHRSQWVSFPGAPQTQTLTMHAPVYTDAVNLGLSFINDKIGPVKSTGLFFDYAFRMKLSKKDKLAFGLKFGCNNYAYNLSDLQNYDYTDAKIYQSENMTLPNIGVGIYFSNKDYYAGLSVPKLLQNNYLYVQTSSADYFEIERMHFYFIWGGFIPLTPTIKLKPSTLIKVTQAAPIEVDFTTEFFFDEKYSLGCMLRTGDGVGVLLGLAINKHLSLGYSFDWSFVNETANYNYGSHEVVLQYDFSPKRKKMFDSIKAFCKF